MFWGFLLFLVLALVFAQLGAYSVWFAILKGGLYLASVVIGGLVIVLLLQRVFGQKTADQDQRAGSHLHDPARGGTFEGQNYKTAGGLHGVGASVVNALSRELIATVRRDGSTWEQKYKQGAPVGGVKKLGPARGTGTTVFFRPDATIFPKVDFDPAVIRERLEVASYLHKGVKVVFEDEAAKSRDVFEHTDGLEAYLKKLFTSSTTKTIHEAPFVLARDNGLRLDLAMHWTEGTDEQIRSYVNGIPTGSGGTHENGLRAGIGKAVRNFIDTHNLSPKGVTLTADDIREGLVGVLSVFIAEPQFQGQTKDRLNNPELLSAVDSVVRPALEHWLNHNISVAEAIVARIILAARAGEASRAAQQEVTRKSATSNRLNLPGKLSDCSASGREDSELFIVEGYSAGNGHAVASGVYYYRLLAGGTSRTGTMILLR